MADATDKIRALFARACDPGTTEEEARTSAVLLCRLAQKHNLDLFVARADNRSGLLAPEEVLSLVKQERDAGERRLRLLMQNHAAEISFERRRADAAIREARESVQHARGELGNVQYARSARVGAPLRPPIVLDGSGTWEEVYGILASMPPGAQVEVRRASVNHPADEGAQRSIGMPHGQARDWRFPPDGAGRGLHVHEFRRTWVAHLDERHPSVDLAGHLRRDVFG